MIASSHAPSSSMLTNPKIYIGVSNGFFIQLKWINLTDSIHFIHS